MGVDIHSLNFLKFAFAKQPFGRVATIGRQALNLDPLVLQRHLRLDRPPDFGAFSETLLRQCFGAQCVDSYDNSSYEDATFVADMNRELQAPRGYDTVYDGGCLEHVYNAAQALHNVSTMCVPGGQILHVLPANNFCGHGFWQFSPELFFSLYSERNGYQDTQVFVADLLDTEFWYEVKKPREGLRANIGSTTALYLLVRTKRAAEWFSHSDIQQSDYVELWKGAEASETRPASALARLPLAIQKTPLAPLARSVYRRYRRWSAGLKSLSGRNPELVRHAVSSLV